MRKTILLVFLGLLAGALAFAIEPQKDSRGWLGVTVTKGHATLSGDGVSGAKINSFYRYSPAREAGLERHDLIIRIDGVDVKSVKELGKVLKATRPGDSVWVDVIRNGKEETFEVWLADQSVLSDGIAKGAPEKKEHHTGESRGFLGVNLLELTADLRVHFGSDEHTGVLISRVLKEHAAERAGLQAGDVIIEVNGESVGSVGELQKIIRRTTEGDEATVVILRHEKVYEIPVIMGGR